jgi:hypothetical protein
MILTRIAALAAITLALTVSVQARPHKAHHRQQVQQSIITCNQQGCSDRVIDYTPERSNRTSERRIEIGEGVVGGRPAGCPWRYCGCGVSLKVFGKIIPKLNLALNWKIIFPRTEPAAGMVAARSGHVFYIVSVVDSSTVVAYDPNSGGHKTRIHTVSLRGFTVVDPHGSKVAMN